MTRGIMMALAFAVLAGFSGLAAAADLAAGELRVEQAWARASATQSAKAGAAYFTLVNLGAEPDRLIGVATPLTRKAGLHNHVMDQGMMKMLPVAAIEISPGEPTVLRPGGLHVMLMGLKAPLIEGETFTLTLTFEKAGPVEIEVTIQGPAAMQHGTMHQHGQS
ncbi:MAG: copper chaperone PCu(A)C [Alphaproteobacteria bacterium]